MSNENAIVIVTTTEDWDDAKVNDQKQNLQERITQFSRDNEHKFHKATTRL